MTLGGAAVVTTTVLVAAMHGGLSALTGAVLVGCSAYATTRRVLNMLPETVERTQQQVLELQLRKQIEQIMAANKGKKGPAELEKDEAKVKALRKDAKAVLDGLHEACEQDKWGNREMAAYTGIASLAYPPFGLVILGGNLAVLAGVLKQQKSVSVEIDWLQAVKQAMATAA